MDKTKKMVGGFSIKYNDKLILPYYLSHEDPRNEVLAREAVFSFPLATAGWFVAGPVGVATGHIIGAIVGFVRHKRIEEH